MYYLDTNIYFFAFYKTKKGQILTPKVQWMKYQAQSIIRRIDDGELQVCISLLQLSELANIFKSRMNWTRLRQFLWNMISNDGITVLEVSKMLYINAIDKIPEMNMDSNDNTSYLLMKEHDIGIIYSFDKHFRNLTDIKCLPEFPAEF
ncbi:MAG: type II toxin-antitoxin system VapC family toxin [Promethearchaeota archaeon]